MSDLVQRLSSGEHPVEITIRPARTILALNECLDRGYVHVKFTDTRGGTELGVRLDMDSCDLAAARTEQAHGEIKLIGKLKLDYVPVRCVAQVDVTTFEGRGHLEPTGEEEGLKEQ